ncbi:MAG: CBS domain-containing protein [Halodesulfurarchaeum sp.]
MRSYRIGEVFDIPIQISVTFLVILPVFTWLIGSRVARITDMLNQLFGIGLDAAAITSGSTPWILGIVAAIGLFVGVVLHELGHSLVSIHYGYSIASIKLWLLGGVSKFTEQPENWKHELLIAIAGPAVSVGLSFLCWGVLRATPSFSLVQFVFGYLAVINGTLAVFNLLPGFPLDGGRVLRALLARTRSFAQATQIAATIGKVVAFLLGLAGLLGGNFILIGVALFIYIGASSEAQQTVMQTAFEGVTISDVMTPDDEVKTVSPDMTVSDLTESMFRWQHTGYPVIEDGHLVGVVTLEDANEIPEEERDAHTVADIMTPDTELKTISPATDAMDALNTMQQEDIGRLIVTDDDDNLLGLLSRSDLITAFNILRSSSRESARIANKA